MFRQEQPDGRIRAYHAAMFRIVLQPEEQALLSAIGEGICPAGILPDPLLLKLMALRLVVCDDHGNPRLTDLARAALARMQGRMH